MAGTFKTSVKIGSEPTKGYFERVKGTTNATFGGVRNNPIYAKNTPSRMGKEIAQALMVSTLKDPNGEREMDNERKVLASAIRYGANVEARRLMTFITAQLIGNLVSNRAGGGGALKLDTSTFARGLRKPAKWKPAFDTGGTVTWEPLSLGWMNEKGNELYFKDSGELKRQLSGMRASYPVALGGIVVKERSLTKKGRGQLIAQIHAAGAGRSRSVVLGSIDIQIFPNATPNLFPGLLTGRTNTVDITAGLERSSFIPQNIRDKLMGPKRGDFAYRFRPMMGPVTQFWMMHRIPAAIALAIEKGTRKRDRSDDWMK